MTPPTEPARPRIFPHITPDLYRTLEGANAHAPDERAARRLLALANRPLTIWQRYLDWKLTAGERLARALGLHKQALEAELAARYERADFFWRQLQHEFKAFTDKDELWAEALKAAQPEAGAAVMSELNSARARLVDEVFVDTHWAFYRSYAPTDQPLTPQSRALVHFDYLAAFVAHAGLTEAQAAELLREPAEALAALGRETKQWQPAETACELLLQHCPGAVEYQQKLADIYFGRTISQIKNGTSDADYKRDAAAYLKGIERTEQLRRRYPDCAVLYEYLGHLYHLRAIKLANAGSVALALQECEKARAHYPPLTEAEQTKDELIKLMRDLQERVRELVAQVSRTPNARLNAKGMQMRTEANTGFDLINKYIDSDEQKQTIEAYYRARDRRVWERTGLAAPADRWAERARLLVEALGYVMSNPPADRFALGQTWAQVAASHPDLAALDPAPVTTFLYRQLYTDGAEPPVQPQPVRASAALAPATMAKATRGGEPFGYWLFSRQNLRIKAQAAIAVLLLLLAGGLIVRNAYARRVRDTAFDQVVAANARHEHLRVIEGAEQFLAHPALGGKDGREARVLSLYNEALVRWVAQQPGKLSEDALAHVSRYRQLVGVK